MTVSRGDKALTLTDWGKPGSDVSQEDIGANWKLEFARLIISHVGIMICRILVLGLT